MNILGPSQFLSIVTLYFMSIKHISPIIVRFMDVLLCSSLLFSLFLLMILFSFELKYLSLI